MKRRFEVTLLAVAIASLSASAFALAPTISDFRSPIIADDTPATNSNDFVYPDAIDLDQQGTDPDATVASSGIIWSFTSLSGPSTIDNTYRLNNRQAMNILGGDNPNAPGTKEVGKTGQDDPEQVDNNPRTITFRNQTLSPVQGDGVTVGPNDTSLNGHPGLALAYTRLITMFASDGTTYTMGTAKHGSYFVYTEKNGTDRLSQPAGGGTSIIAPTNPATFTGGNAWISSSPFHGFSGFTDPTFSNAATAGLCMATPLATSAVGSWYSPYGLLPLVANQVYRVRVKVSAPTPIAVGASPLWDFIIDNTDSGSVASPTHVQSKYGGDFYFWDNAGGANSAGADPNSGTQPGDHQFDIWWTPLAVNSPGWNDSTNGEFSAANAGQIDGRLQFRLLDTANSAVDGQNDAGTLCMTSIQVDRYAYSSLVVSSTPFNVASAGMTLSAFNVNNLFNGIVRTTGTTGDMTLSVSNGIQIVPNTAGAWDAVEIINVDPGDGVYNPVQDTGITDDFPIAYQANQLLRFTAGIQASDAASQSHPPDAFRMNFDTPSSEVQEQNILGLYANTIGGPTASAVTDYATFFFTHHVPASSNPADWTRARPRIGALTLSSLHAVGYNCGGFKITYEKVDVIDTSSLN